MNKATIYDVAAVAKVSNATVSRALNNPEKVKPETRDKVLKVAKELGYKANAFAKGLASSKSTQVAVIVSDLARASVAEMVKGIGEVATNYGYSILLFPSASDEKYEELLTNLISYQVDGILYLNDEITDHQYKLIKDLETRYQIPLVLVNTVYESDANLLSVAIDYEKAGYEVTKALVQEGRKHIALLTTQKRYPVSELKEKGYLRAIEYYGLQPEVCYTSGNLDSNQKDLSDFVKSHEIDGVIGVRDSIAISCMNILKNLGRKIPEDVSIFGFQNTRYTLLCRPTLSTINVPIYEIGARAMKVLTAEMMGETQEQKGQILLEHSIIKRETTR
ncbi:MAG: LacI family DNA-binding transcriptional regulator [Bacillales bacterium]|nr:LacI family DNA-binding transcriptional regulator [Bacillales bacterium]